MSSPDPLRSDPFAELIGESSAIERVRQALRAVVGSAGPRSNVLLVGEAGSGKTLIAGLLARLGCPHAPQVAVNVASLPNGRMLPGLFRAAQGGTIVLEEINQLDPTTQLALFKAIREPGARRQGPPTATSWIISTTNMDPLAAVRYGRFRNDLYRQLATVFIAMPALRDRGSDVIKLAEWLVAGACARHGRAVMPLASNAEEWLTAYGWPGNVRQLTFLIERVVFHAEDSYITADMLDRSAHS